MNKSKISLSFNQKRCNYWREKKKYVSQRKLPLECLYYSKTRGSEADGLNISV